MWGLGGAARGTSPYQAEANRNTLGSQSRCLMAGGSIPASAQLHVRKSKTQRGTSLVTWWIRIQLPMQGIWVRSLVREDFTCREQLSPCATK